MKDLLRSLLAIDEELNEFIIHAAPTTPEEIEAIRDVSRLRDRLDVMINRLQDLRFAVARIDLTLAISEVRDVQKQLVDIAEKVENAKKVIETTNKVLEIAGTVVAKVAPIVA